MKEKSNDIGNVSRENLSEEIKSPKPQSSTYRVLGHFLTVLILLLTMVFVNWLANNGPSDFQSYGCKSLALGHISRMLGLSLVLFIMCLFWFPISYYIIAADCRKNLTHQEKEKALVFASRNNYSWLLMIGVPAIIPNIITLMSYGIIRIWGKQNDSNFAFWLHKTIMIKLMLFFIGVSFFVGLITFVRRVYKIRKQYRCSKPRIK